MTLPIDPRVLWETRAKSKHIGGALEKRSKALPA